MNDKENRTKSIKIRLTPTELNKIEQLAEESSARNLSDFIRQVVLTGKFKVPKVSQNFENLLYEINKIGNNINQISKHCNINNSVDIKVLEQLTKIEEKLSILMELCEC